MSQMPRQVKPKEIWRSCKVLGHSFPNTKFNIMSSNCLNSLWKIKMDHTAIFCVFIQSPQMSQIPRQVKPKKIWKSCKVLGHSFPNTNFNMMSSNCLNSLWKIKMVHIAIFFFVNRKPFHLLLTFHPLLDFRAIAGIFIHFWIFQPLLVFHSFMVFSSNV